MKRYFLCTRETQAVHNIPLFQLSWAGPVDLCDGTAEFS